MLTVSGLTKSFGSRTVVDDLAFEIEPGSIVGLLGPNGSGKSTTFRILATLLPPTAGTVTIAHHDLATQVQEIRKVIGFLPEDLPIYPELTVSEYLEFFSDLRGLSRRGRKLRLEALYEQCQLETVVHMRCAHLSKGFRQRLGLAQAIIHDPAVLLLDEPTNGLDPEQSFEMRTFLKRFVRDKVVLVSSHLLHEITQLCDRALILRNGKLVGDERGLEEAGTAALEQIFLQRPEVTSVVEVAAL